MYELSIVNEFSEVLPLTNNPDYDIIAVAGLNPPPAAINTVAVSGIDGTRYNSARLGERNVVIDLHINGDIEANRINLYKYFRVKHKIRIRYKNEHVDVYIDGYVDTFENNLFTMSQRPQISIICPEPYWKSTTETGLDFDTIIALFEFPFSIPAEGIAFSELDSISSMFFDAGNVATGAVITFTALANGVKSPTFYNRTTGEFFGVGITMQSGDVITINTQQGEKSVTQLRGGVVTNLINGRLTDSSWLVFEPGMNEVSYGADEGASALRVALQITQKFEGV